MLMRGRYEVEWRLAWLLVVMLELELTRARLPTTPRPPGACEATTNTAAAAS